MAYIDDFKQVSVSRLKALPAAEALVGMRANEARRVMSKYKYASFVTKGEA